MLDIPFGRAAALVVAVAAPVLQHLADCGSTRTEQYTGPVFEVLGPETVTQNAPAIYRIENAALGSGPGAPCPENVTFSFIDEFRADPVVVSVPKPATTKLADGTCVVNASATHAFPTTGRGEVDAEVSAKVVQNGRAARIVKVSAPAGGVTTTGTTTPTPTPTPVSTGGFKAGVEKVSNSHPFGVVAGNVGPAGINAIATIEDAPSASDMDRVEVYPVDGAGAVGAPTPYDLGAGADPVAIASRDLDKDGLRDLVVLTTNHSGATATLRIYTNGAGGFGAPTSLTVPSSAQSLAIGDVTDDGAPDIIVGCATAVLVYKNTNTSTGIDPSPSAASTGTRSPFSLAVLDADNDGHGDLALTDVSTPGVVSVMLGNGSGGTFGTPQDLVSDAGMVPYAIAAGDVRGDAHADLVVARHTEHEIQVLRNDSTTPGTAVFSGGPLAADANGKNPVSVTLADLDGDGRSEILTANYVSGNVSIYRNPGAAGDFAPPEHLAAGTGPQGVAVADLNGDGRQDVIAANYGNVDFGDPSKDVNGSVSVFLANPPAGTRSFRTAGLADAFAAAVRKPKAATVKVGGGATITIKALGTASYGADGTGHLKGTRMVGVLKATISKTDRRRIGAAAAAILNARFAGKVDADRHVDPANGNPILANGMLAATATTNRRLQACLKATPGKNGLQHFVLVGGTGALATLRISGDVWPFSIDKVGRKGPKAAITVAKGPRRPLSVTCKALLRQVPKR